MVAELGHFALLLALAVALAQTVLPLWGARTGNAALMETGQTAALAQFGLVLLSFLSLMWCYVTSDFSVANVALNSHTTKPLVYKIAGVWGNHEGSMLLWVLMLAAFGAAVAVFGRNLPASLKATVLSVQASIALAFCIFMAATSNPFLRLNPVPTEGQGLNPVL